MNNPLEKLESIINVLETDRASTDEVAEAIQVVLALIEKTREELEQNMAQNKGEMTEEVEAKHEAMMARCDELKAEMEAKGQKMGVDIDLVKTQLLAEINEVRGMIPEAADFTEVYTKIAEVESKIPKIPEIPNVEPLKESIKKLEDDVEEIKKDIEELKKRPVGSGGGGTSAAAVARAFKYIFKAETPSGTINGSNVTFTVQNSIWAILSIELNGEVYPSTGYSAINHTITFSVAPPAVYSGKDFICKYIAS